MGKVNKNIKAKAKKAISSVAASLQDATTAKRVTQAAIEACGKSSRSDDKIDLLLHKTQTPRKTITKKEKLRQKHKNLLNKFAQMKKQRKEERARKQRQQTAVVGDLKPLKDALPSLDELFRLSKTKDALKTGVKEYDKTNDAEEKVEEKLTRKQKLQRKRNKFISKVNSYQAILQDPDFKKNPRDTIAYHIKYTHGLIDE